MKLKRAMSFKTGTIEKERFLISYENMIRTYSECRKTVLNNFVTCSKSFKKNIM